MNVNTNINTLMSANVLFFFFCLILNVGESHVQSADQFWNSLSKCVLHMSLGLGLQACELAISTRTVWARCPNGDIARRYGITDKNPAGDYWKKIPGNVSCLTGVFFDMLSGVKGTVVGIL